MNEATWVQGKCLGVMYNGGSDHAWSIFDANWQNDLLSSLEHGGGMFWDTFRPYGSDYQVAVDGHTKTVENGLDRGARTTTSAPTPWRSWPR